MKRQLRSDVDDSIKQREDDSHARRIMGLAQRREAPRFIMCDPFMNVISASPEIDVALSSRETLASLAPACRESRASAAPVFHVHNDETVLRIVPLTGALFGSVIIFVDTFSHRGSIFETAKTFGLTKRESETLQLLVRGKTNADLAELLCVAESTIGDHVKSVMRKLNVSKRGELVSRIFNLEQDLVAQLAREPHYE
jgi:DNA-binding CsgD family transcriptional regulator